MSTKLKSIDTLRLCVDAIDMTDLAPIWRADKPYNQLLTIDLLLSFKPLSRVIAQQLYRSCICYDRNHAVSGPLILGLFSPCSEVDQPEMCCSGTRRTNQSALQRQSRHCYFK
jgi:hypothetical protein